MLSAIGEIKGLRERTAQSAVTRQRRILDCRIEDVAKAEDELARFADWRVQEERRLYDSIMGSKVDLKRLDNVKHQIGLLRLKEVSLEQEVERTHQEKSQAEADLHQAEQKLAEARKAVEKCQTLIDHLAGEEQLTAQRAEENELEEAGTSAYMRLQA